MIVAIGATGVLLGAALAYCGSFVPRYQREAEAVGGILLIGGLGLLGYLLNIGFGEP